ncbi:MAG TPA: hypothetical protein VER79_08725 [Candidatus Limnocylindrales bacterium]|nr:hypothetical protein [Candidatus Limnocylindrales bacterium]
MRRGTFVLVIFVLIAAVIVGISFFLRAQPALETSISVSPMAEAWLRDAAASFNASNPTVNGTQSVRVTVQPLDEADIALGESSRWAEQNHADGWIPAAVFAIEFAQAQGLPMEMFVESVAQTSLVWGGFSSVVDQATDSGAQPFDWPAVNEAIASQPIRLAFRSPSSTIDGFAVLLSGTAALNESTAITRDSLRSPAARDWLENTLQAVPNTTTLGASAAQAMAARGPSVGGLALLPESEWLNNLRGQLVSASDPLQLAYPEFTVVFTFPCAAWSNPATQDTSAGDRFKAVGAFCDFLLTPAQQANAVRFGLRPAGGILDPEAADMFMNAAQYGILLDPSLANVVEAPRRSDAQLLALAASQIAP